MMGVATESDQFESAAPPLASLLEPSADELSADEPRLRAALVARLRVLALDRLDAVYSNRDVGFALIAKLGLTDKIRYSGTHRKLKYYIGLSMAHNDKSVLDRFDAAYRKLHEAGVVKKILDRHSLQVADLE